MNSPRNTTLELDVLTEIRDLLAAQSAELLSVDAVAAMLSISPRAPWQPFVQPANYPAPIHINNRVLFRRRDIFAWLDGKQKRKTR